ncbi:hypothetical protein H0H93_015683 [Arthromyces matolae]|nr:hypothetical protein H0H93_015683 [Arthromyces matolae]
MSLSSDLTPVAPKQDYGREPTDSNVNRDQGMNFASSPEKGRSEQQATSLADVNSSLLIPKDKFQNAPEKIQPSPRPLTRQPGGYYDPKTGQFSSRYFITNTWREIEKDQPLGTDGEKIQPSPRPLTRQPGGYYDPKTGQFSSKYFITNTWREIEKDQPLGTDGAKVPNEGDDNTVR